MFPIPCAHLNCVKSASASQLFCRLTDVDCEIEISAIADADTDLNIILENLSYIWKFK